jgi:hypothetical protein
VIRVRGIEVERASVRRALPDAGIARRRTRPPLNRRVRTALLVGCVLAWTARALALPDGQEDLIASMLGKGEPLPGPCVFDGGRIDGEAIFATYACPSGAFKVELHVLRPDSTATMRTRHFALVVDAAAAPNGFAEELAARIQARESAIVLDDTVEGWEPSWRLALLACIAIAAMCLLLMYVASLGRVAVATGATWNGPALCSTLRCAGLLAIVIVAAWTVTMRTEPAVIRAFTWTGIVGVASLLWLSATGFFGFATLRRSDWVALIPFVIALIVRERFTLHSIQELEIFFVLVPLDKHSFVYPMFQMLFLPFVRDAHWWMMHLNGIIGACATLPLYLFARQRLDSRSAGFLCALFFATHPLLARFAPTDGPYSLLLFTWFAGLALLAAPTVDARAMLGGTLLLGVAATTRVEGAVFIVAALLLLNPRSLVDGARRHPRAALSAVLALAGLIALHVYFVLPMHLGEEWPVEDGRRMFFEPTWPALYDRHVFFRLIALGVLFGVVARRGMAIFALPAMLVVFAPVVPSSHIAALHRQVPSWALQAVVAAIGAYALVSWIPRNTRWRWLTVIPGTVLASVVFVEHSHHLTRPYVFNEEYRLVRSHLAPNGEPIDDCPLLVFSPPADLDIHTFAQVVPRTRVVDCRLVDCLPLLRRRDACAYYLRSVASYLRLDGVPPACSDQGVDPTGNRTPCLMPEAAALEQSVVMEPIEVRTIDVYGTFADARAYPRQVEIGLFRVDAK